MAYLSGDTTDSTSTTSSTADPADWFRPFLQTGLNEASNLYNNRPGSLTPNGYTQTGWERMARLGDAPDVTTARNTAWGIAQGDGMGVAAPGRAAMDFFASGGGVGGAGRDTLSTFANGGGIGQDGRDTLGAGTGMGFTSDAGASDYYRRTLAGDYLTQNNPFFQPMVDQSIAAARPSMDAAFAGNGRFGSGAHAAAFADAATRASTALGYQDYARERGAQDAAAGALTGIANRDAASRLGAAGTLAGLGQSDAQMRMGAANNLANFDLQDDAQRLQAAGALTTAGAQDRSQRLQAAGMTPGLAQVGINGILQAGAGIDANGQRIADYGWDQLGRFSGLLGLGSPYSTRSGTTTTPVTGQSTLGTGLGLASTGVGLASSLYGLGKNLWGGSSGGADAAAETYRAMGGFGPWL